MSKYAVLAGATFFGALSVAGQIAIAQSSSLTTLFGAASEVCGIVALVLFLYYTITDTGEMIKGDKNDRY